MTADRKALIRQYKETPRTRGVGRVHNTRDDKSFVVTSRDLPAFLNRQRAQLRIGSHPNGKLQEDWKALGEESFAFEVLDTLTPKDEPGYDPKDDLAVLETMWLEKLDPFEPGGYNRQPK
jgi:hypothetical protein